MMLLTSSAIKKQQEYQKLAPITDQNYYLIPNVFEEN